MELKLADIRMDGGTQPRATLNDDVVAAYAESYAEGVAMPPVEVVYDGAAYWLWDGFHRCVGADRAGLDSIEANVRQGTLDDARWLSYGANIANSLYRSTRDKQRAVEAALAHPKAGGMSNGEIADHCGVSEKTIRNHREPTSENPKSTPRTGRDGRTINTANIGKGRKTRTVEHVEAVDPDTGEVIDNPTITKRVMTVEEYEALPDEALPKRRGVGLQLAYEAIAVLKRIPPRDGLRREGLERVALWATDALGKDAT